MTKPHPSAASAAATATPPRSTEAEAATATAIAPEAVPRQRPRRSRGQRRWPRRLLVGLLLVVALAALGFLLGPRPAVDPTAVPEPELPESTFDIASMIRDREATVDGLTLGTAARVTWGFRPGVRTPLSFVYLHGFTASRREITPVVEWTAAKFRANAYFARLDGHGQDTAALGRATAQQWLADGLEALRIGERLGERVVLVGTSTGGSLATWLAATHPDSVAALVLISPNFGPRDDRTQWITGPWGNEIAKIASGGTVEFDTYNEQHGRYWTRGTVPVEAVVQMMVLVDLARQQPLERLTMPVMMWYHPDDPTLRPNEMLAAFQRMPNPANRLVDISQQHDPTHHHVITGAVLSPTTTTYVVEELTAYVREHLAVPATSATPTASEPSEDAEPDEAGEMDENAAEGDEADAAETENEAEPED